MSSGLIDTFNQYQISFLRLRDTVDIGACIEEGKQSALCALLITKGSEGKKCGQRVFCIYPTFL
jgi:hypothetical protein